MPPLEQGDTVDVFDIKLEAKQTEPPARYSQGKLVQEMEKRGLGTKSTRASIIDTLYQRKYLKNDPCEPSQLGMAIIDALHIYAPRITTPEMTSELEDDMNKVAEGADTQTDVVNHSRALLAGMMDGLIEHTEDLSEAIADAVTADAKIGVCPKCGKDARRETDTMPQWAGSSWYFLRYMDPHNDKELVSKEAEEYWGPVDWYNGGMEHTTLHLLYSRFWHKFLYDIGVVHTKEPYAKRTSHGMILGKNPHYVGNAKTEEEKQALREKYGAQAERPAVKMSKSLGNVVNPDDVIKAYGADTMRLYIMFIGDFEKTASWSDEAVKGSKRFLDRCWNLMDRVTDDPEISQQNMAAVHKTIKKVTNDIDELKMNTAIAALMALVNDFYAKGLSKGDLEALLKLLSPFAPHMVEEMWELMGYAQKYGKMCMQMPWPGYDESKTIDATAEMAVQVNGKLKGTVVVPTDSDEQTVVAAAMALEKVKKSTEGMTVVKTILVKNKLVNLIVKPAK